MCHKTELVSNKLPLGFLCYRRGLKASEVETDLICDLVLSDYGQSLSSEHPKRDGASLKEVSVHCVQNKIAFHCRHTFFIYGGRLL